MVHHTETTLKSTFQRSGTPAERFQSRERERRRKKRDEVRALSNRDLRSKSRDRRGSGREETERIENRLIVRHDQEDDDDGNKSRARSKSRSRKVVQGNLTERSRIGCLGSSTDRTFRPKGASLLGPPTMISTTDDYAAASRSQSRGRRQSLNSMDSANRRSKSRGNRTTGRGKSVSRSEASQTSRARSRSRPSDLRTRSQSRDGRVPDSRRSMNGGNDVKQSQSRGNVKRSQSRTKTIDDHVSSTRPRSQSRGRKEEQTLSSKSKSCRSKSRGSRADEGTVKSKASRSQSRGNRSSGSQTRGGDENTVVTSRSSKSLSRKPRSSATVVSSASLGWKRFVDHTPLMNLTHYSGSSGKFSRDTEETSPLSLHKHESQDLDSQASKKGKKNRKSSPAMPPFSPDVYKSTTYDPNSARVVTNLYDQTGHCVNHPHVRLRKKKLWGGGWNILISNCPDCCLEEMGRLAKAQREREKETEVLPEKKEKKKKKENRSSHSVYPSPSPDFHEARSVRSSKSSRRFNDSAPPTQSADPYAPIFEFDIPLDEQPGHHPESFTSPKSVRSRKSHKSSRSVKTNKSARSSGGKSTRTSKSAKSSKSKSSKKNTQPKEHDSTRRSSALSAATPLEVAACVAKMPYTDQYGMPGKYSGEVNSFGRPHGKGALVFDDGRVDSGIWVDGRCNVEGSAQSVSNQSVAKSVSNRSIAKSVSNRSVSNKSVSGRSHRSSSHSPGQNPHQPSPYHHQQPHPYHQTNSPKLTRYISQMPWSDVNGFSGHYTGEVNDSNAPEGTGYMQYSNGVIEEGTWRNGVFQPPLNFPHFPYNEGGNVPSSSMSVWSLKSTPNMSNNGSRHGSSMSMHGERY